MAELHDRFRSLDRVAVPDLWAEVEQRAVASVPEPLRVRLPAFGRRDAARVPRMAPGAPAGAVDGDPARACSCARP